MKTNKAWLKAHTQLIDLIQEERAFTHERKRMDDERRAERDKYLTEAATSIAGPLIAKIISDFDESQKATRKGSYCSFCYGDVEVATNSCGYARICKDCLVSMSSQFTPESS